MNEDIALHIASFFSHINLNYFRVNKQFNGLQLKILIRYNQTHDRVDVQNKREPVNTICYIILDIYYEMI